MIAVEIPELGATLQLASSYKDLQGKDAARLVRSVYASPMDMGAKYALLQKLMVAPEQVWKALEEEENREQLWRLIQTLDWVWKGPEVRPLAFLKVRGKELFLPDENLHHITTAEFVVATAHLMGFWSAKDQRDGLSSLAKFIATIARPKPDVLTRIRKRPDHPDPREAYSTLRTEFRAAAIQKTDPIAQILIAQWFNNAANRLLKTFGMASADPEAAAITQGAFVQDWERQIVKVAETGVYGRYDDVMTRPVTDVLTYIDLKNDESRKSNSTS
jgi:hypothetical protein